MYYHRFKSTDINPLVYEAFQVNKSLHSEGIYSWYSYIGTLTFP